MTTPPLALRDPTTEPTFSYDTSPDLFLFTSLTAGSSHILTATSRLETILKANRIPFRAVDIATDEKARRIWTRRAGKRKIPGLVKEAMIVADLEQVEEWNEFDEIKQELGGEGRLTTAGMVKSVAASTASKGSASSPMASTSKDAEGAKTNAVAAPSIQNLQAKQQGSLAAEAAAVAAARKKAATAITSTPSTSSTAARSKEPPTTPSTEDTSEPTTTSAPAPAPALAPAPTARSPTLPTAEQDSVDAFTSTSPPTHNTSATVGLPALSLRTNAASPSSTAKGILSSTSDAAHATSPQAIRAKEESTTYPSAPPRTAVEAAAGADANTGCGLISGSVAEEGAAPAVKSGLDAVTSDPKGMAKAMETGKVDAAGAEPTAGEGEGEGKSEAAER